MSLTNIGDQRTPGRPVEITFGADTGLPSANQEVLLIGHKAASGTAANYVVGTISNSADVTAASGEVATKFGLGTELANMVLAAIRANAGASTFPTLKFCPLAPGDTDFGPADAALTAIDKVKAEFVVSPYDGNDTSLRNDLKNTAVAMSGAQRVENNQFGTMGVVFNRSITDPASLPTIDSLNMIGIWMPDTDANPDYSIGEMAAASAAKIASLTIPFNPLDSETLQNVPFPVDEEDWITVGAGLQSEVCLNQGWTPLYVKPNTEVAFVRTVTSRLSVDGSGSPVVNAYYDVQDFMVLFFWRKTIFTRLSQPDLKQTKASEFVARNVKSEMIRLATQFEDQQMFQAVTQLAKEFQVERSPTDRHRFDVKTPVNVIPGLHVIAANVEATTRFDIITV